jgi:hypothetical protein
MKKLVLFLALLPALMAARPAFTQETAPVPAREAARNWLAVKHMPPVYRLAGPADTIADGSQTLAYCFGLYPRGYIVVSASYLLPPVVAYSFEAPAMPAEQPANPLYNMLIHDLPARLAYYSEAPEKAARWQEAWSRLLHEELPGRHFQQWPPQGSTSTGGWLETNWSQSSPWNNLCPLDEVTGLRSVAGCPAVALAMIIHYQKNLNGTRFTDDDDYYHSYAGRQYWIDDDHEEMDFPSFPRLNGYLDSIAARFPLYMPITTEEAAALLFACGVAARQVYTSNVSGTFGVTQAYDAYLRFGYTDAMLIYESDTFFYACMRQNMMDGMPVHLALLVSNGQGGHNVVADGYNTDDFYHLNFGWGGSYNGWYLLPEGIPYNLTTVEGAVMDIGVSHVGMNDVAGGDGLSLAIYPNPAGGHLNITLDIPHGTEAVAAIRDMGGRLVAEIFRGKLQKGRHQLTWTGSLPPGRYQVIVQGGKSMKQAAFIISR